MLTVLQSLKSISAYPIPMEVVINACEEQGIDYNEDAVVYRNTAGYKRAKSSLCRFLAMAPNVSQNGVSYSFTSDERRGFSQMAASLEKEADGASGYAYGYVGEDF